MKKVKSLGLFVGAAACDAYCAHCAGIPLRIYAPKQDGQIPESLFTNTLNECYDAGARYLSITGCGEPTLSPLAVTSTLQLVNQMALQGKIYSPVNLYSNGIRIGRDKKFAEQYLPLWKSLGLTSVYLTVHDLDNAKNAKIYGVTSYPSLTQVIERIYDTNMRIRANIILSNLTINTAIKFSETINGLLDKGVDSISAWPMRNLEDAVDLQLIPPEEELHKMSEWIDKHPHAKKINLILDKNNPECLVACKLTLFQNGVLSSSWC